MKKVLLRLYSIKPDHRQFRNQSIELAPKTDLFVEVQVPESEVIESDVDGVEAVVITAAGLRNLTDQFDAVFVLENSKPNNVWETVSDKENSDDGWDFPETDQTTDDGWD